MKAFSSLETIRCSGFFVSTFGNGNMKLCCLTQHRSGLVYVSKEIIDAFAALPCSGDKLIWFCNRNGRVDVVMYLDELGELDFIDNGDGRLHYLVGPDSIKYPRHNWNRSAWPD